MTGSLQRDRARDGMGPWRSGTAGSGRALSDRPGSRLRRPSADEVLAEIRWRLGEGSPARLAYTRWAFESLPWMACPRILDVGCGRGGPTLELARLTPGVIVGLDTDLAALKLLERRAAEEQRIGRVRLVRASLAEMPFDDESFDIIWAEGSVWVVGLEEALHEWRRHLVPRGYLVVHEMVWLRPNPPPQIADHLQATNPGIRTIAEYLGAARRYGYDPVASRQLPADFWWQNYYRPLGRSIKGLRSCYEGDLDALRVLDRAQLEVEFYETHRSWYGSAFLIMQNAGPRTAPFLARAATERVRAEGRGGRHA